MFRSPSISELLRYHSDNPNPDASVMKSVVDSPAWKHIDNDVDISFTREARNLRFRMVLDGVIHFCIRIQLIRHGLY
jgi:hypothetical protein